MRSVIKKLIAVVSKELRSQMRGGRAFALFGAYLLLLIGFEWSIAKVFLINSERMGAEAYKLGFMLFTTLSLFQLLLISFITPSFTAGAISHEKEQQTFDLLIVSEISPISVILGKLVSSLGYVFLLIIASVPVMSTVFLFGSVSPGDFLATFLILIITTVTFGSIGIFFSSLVKKTQVATALTYGTVLFLLVATLIGSSLISTYIERQYLMFRQGPPPKAQEITSMKSYKMARFLLRLSPINAMTSITGMTPELYSGGPYSSPYSLLLIPMPQFRLDSMIINTGGMEPILLKKMIGSGVFVDEGSRLRGAPGQKDEKNSGPRPDWHYTVAIYLSLSAVLLFISSRLLLPYHRWRLIRIPFLKRFRASPPEATAGQES
ncbi:MAG: ABC transporter permease [Actinomycetota bacterium]|nr:ABC transporter permease [Actinomycetota bacterium]